MNQVRLSKRDIFTYLIPHSWLIWICPILSLQISTEVSLAVFVNLYDGVIYLAGAT